MLKAKSADKSVMVNKRLLWLVVLPLFIPLSEVYCGPVGSNQEDVPAQLSALALTPAYGDKAFDGDVDYHWSVHVDTKLASFERKIALNDVCFDPNTGYPSKKCWWQWTELRPSALESQQYAHTTTFNPSIGYLNWSNGKYLISVRGTTSNGLVSNIQTVDFWVFDGKFE